MNPITAIKKAIKFVTYDVWRMTGDGLSDSLRYLINVIKAVFLSVRFFFSDRMMERASALTYYTLLSLVPVFALLLGIAKGFNVQEMVEMSLANAETGQNQAITYLFTFADSYLQQTNSGIIMGIGIVMLLWVIYSTIGNIERVFNDIWQVKKGRSTLRKVTDYLCIMIIVPLLVFVVCGLQIFTHTLMASGKLDIVLSTTLSLTLKITPYVLIILVFSLTYMVIPNTKVKFRNAIIAGAVAGTAFLAFQNLYINGQIWVSQYSAIYGSFAALPLLLLWMQMSWVICLYGAELSFACQNMSSFNYERDTKNISREYYNFLCYVVCSLVYSQFPKRTFTTEDIATILHLPSKLASNIVQHLSEIKAIRETPNKENREEEREWIPGRETDKYTYGCLMSDMMQTGSSNFSIDYKDLFHHHWELVENISSSSRQLGDTQLLRDTQFDFHKIEQLCNTSKSRKKVFETLFAKH